MIEVREDKPNAPVAHLIGKFKVSKGGVLMFQEPADTDDTWKSVSDDPND